MRDAQKPSWKEISQQMKLTGRCIIYLHVLLFPINYYILSFTLSTSYDPTLYHVIMSYVITYYYIGIITLLYIT